MSDLDYDFDCFGKEKDTPRIWDTGNVKEESRRILDDDRDVILNGPTPDEEDIKGHDQTKKLATCIENSNVDIVKKGSGTKRAKVLFVSLILLMVGKVIAPEMSPETFLQTSVVGSVEIGKDFILNCTCEGICKGNQKWTGGPNNIELAYNQWVLKDKINIIKNSSSEYSIKVLNATETDIFGSNYTCGIGFAAKQINRSELEQPEPSQPPPTQSPTVTSTMSTPQQPMQSNIGKLSDGDIAGIVVGVFVGLVVAAIILVFVIRKYNKYKKQNMNRRRNDDGDDWL